MMDAYSSETDISYSGGMPVLVAGSGDRALARGRSTILSAGMRPLHAGVIETLGSWAASSAMWIEMDEELEDGLPDRLLTQANRRASDGRFGTVVVAAPRSLMDPLAAALDDNVQLIIDADDAERTAALALAVAGVGAERVQDVGGDRNAERLRQLSDEVSRIASTLARLSSGPGAAPAAVRPQPAGELPPLSLDTVRAIIRARRLRSRYFSEELFADPAWDMLLDLLQAEIAQLRVPVSSLCIAAAVPATTALRWLKTLVSQGVFVRRPDPHDGRRVYVELAPDTSQALRRYFAEVGQVAVV